MKPGIQVGQTHTLDITVTEAMRAHFGDITVHDLYSSAAMLTHMEWAARQHILPVLEAGEEGVGARLELDQLGPVAIGETVRITATVTGLKPNRVICRCTAHHGERLVGRGTVVQALLPVARLREKISPR